MISGCTFGETSEETDEGEDRNHHHQSGYSSISDNHLKRSLEDQLRGLHSSDMIIDTYPYQYILSEHSGFIFKNTQSTPYNPPRGVPWGDLGDGLLSLFSRVSGNCWDQ